MSKFEAVYEVLKAIPELQALPGDQIIVRPTDPDFPVVLRRVFPITALRQIPDACVTLSYVETGDPDAGRLPPVSVRPASALRLVGSDPIPSGPVRRVSPGAG